MTPPSNIPFPRRIEYKSDGADIHTAEVDVTTNDCYITRVRIAETSDTGRTFTLTDKSAAATEHYDAVAIAANSVTHENISDEPLYCGGGFGIQADAAGLEVDIVYYVRADKAS